MDIDVLYKYEIEFYTGRLLVQFLFNESKRVHGGHVNSETIKAFEKIETIGFPSKINFTQDKSEESKQVWIKRV